MNRSKNYLNRLVNRILTETLEEKADSIYAKLKNAPTSFDYIAEGETCECGSPMAEGECMECGKMSGDVMEKLHGKQRKLDKNKNGKLDSRDFKIMRGEMSEGETCECGSKEFYEGQCVECGMKKGDILEFGTGASDFTAGMDEEVEEGNAFTKKLKDTPRGKKFKLDNKEYIDNSSLDETLYRLVDGNESALFTENEIIDIIEGIVKEEKEKNNIKKGVQPKGLSAYEKAHKGSGKENKEYLDSVAKKLTDYLKDGSKGKYETSPKHFPKGNGELAKMDKKAYEIGEEGIDYNIETGGINIPDYDEVKPKKETIEKQIKGSSENGNNQDWANAENTGVNDKFAKYFENDKLAELKDDSYKRVPSPVYDEKPSKGKKSKTIKEEFERIQQLMGYNQKTQ
jgi:hypothetical protein